MNASQPKLPTRSKRFGVGKEIGGAVYVHRKYADVLGDRVATATNQIPVNFDYDVVKLNLRNDSVSFIRCKDFDSADEPTVGEILTVQPSGESKRRLPPVDPEIYHHKWLFVRDDYNGFDVENSRRRSLAWISLDDVDRKRIGRKKYWEDNVVPRIVCKDT